MTEIIKLLLFAVSLLILDFKKVDSLDNESCHAKENQENLCHIKNNLTSDGVKIYDELNGLYQDDPSKNSN